MEAVANLLELIVELLKRNYKKPKLWVGTIVNAPYPVPFLSFEKLR